jgi:hypothetical protein
MKLNPLCSQQRAVSCILYQRVFEQISRIRRKALAEKQTGSNKSIKGRSQLRIRKMRYRS